MNNFSFGGFASGLRNRISAAIGAVVGGIAVFLCGAFMTFVLAPQQAVKASQIAKLPIMDAAYINSAEAGADVLISGNLQGNPANSALPDFLAYQEERWSVTVDKDENGNNEPPSGSWSYVGVHVPELSLDANGGAVSILASTNASLGGSLHEKIVDGNGGLSASYNGQNLKDGAVRYQGFYSGDLVTVYGKKGSVGGIVPTDLFGGDRVAFEAYQKQMTTGLLFGGIAFMVCSPFVLIGGLFAAAFGRRRN